MKILIINKFLHPNGGSETYIFKIGDKLQELGNEVQYFGMDHPKRIVGNRIDSYTSNVDFHTKALKKFLYPFKIIYSKEAYNKLWKVLLDFEPDVVHINNFNFQLTPSIIYAINSYEKKAGKVIKVIYTAHDLQLVCPNHLMMHPISKEKCDACVTKGAFQCMKNKCIHGSFVKSLLGSIEATLYQSLKTYKMLDTIICPSKFLKQKLDTNEVLRKKTIVLQNFVDMKKKDLAVIKEDYILYLGRFSEEKGIRTLLEACKALPEISFHFAGNGLLEDEIKKVSNAKIMGFLSGDRLTEEIQKATAVVFPSECYENCPFTVMEAQLCGTPVIASNLGGTPELIKDGETGKLFESKNIKELVEAIKEIVNNQEKKTRYTNACKAVEFDNLNDYTKKLLQIYNEKKAK